MLWILVVNLEFMVEVVGGFNMSKYVIDRKYKRAFSRYLKNSSRSAYARARYYAKSHFNRTVGFYR